MRVTVAVFLLFAIGSCVRGAAFFEEVKQVKMYGKVVKYCEYKKTQLLTGSKIKDMKACMACSCSKKGLTCSSMTHSVNVDGDSECENVVIACRNKWVLKADSTKKCPKHLIPEQVTMVG